MKIWIIGGAVLIIIAAAGIAIANHNDQSNSQNPNNLGTTASPDSATPSKASSAANTNSVSISDFAFNPSNITVKKGTSVTWKNNDHTTHTVTETDGQAGPNSGTLKPGASYSFTYSSVGTYKYDCSIHTMMTGEVTVVE